MDGQNLHTNEHKLFIVHGGDLHRYNVHDRVGVLRYFFYT